MKHNFLGSTMTRVSTYTPRHYRANRVPEGDYSAAAEFALDAALSLSLCIERETELLSSRRRLSGCYAISQLHMCMEALYGVSIRSSRQFERQGSVNLYNS